MSKSNRKIPRNKINKNRIARKNKFIANARKKHGNKYDYSLVKYVNGHTKVKIRCPKHGIFEQMPADHICGKGKGCRKCAFERIAEKLSLTTEEFIKKANEKHDNRYDYSKTNYINCNTKVIIICKVHGEFKQKASSHLVGHNCSECMHRIPKTNHQILDNHTINKHKTCALNKYTTETWIEKVREIHNNKYDYSKVIYIHGKSKVIIICPIHGEFLQRCDVHIRKKGCINCSRSGVHKQEKLLAKFIEKSNEIHQGKYDYSKVKYLRYTEKVPIRCPIHGIFEQTIQSHLRGANCPLCGVEVTRKKNKLSTEDFISNCIKVHGNRYDYSKVIYINAYTKVSIECKAHGIFKQIPFLHARGANCSRCISIGHSNVAIKWLDFMAQKDNIHIEHARNGGEYAIPGSRFRADGFCRETNTIYEFHGCYFHGCKCYDPNETNTISKKSMSELYDKTLQKEAYIRSAGYNLITIWEHEWTYFNKCILKLPLYDAFELITNHISETVIFDETLNYLSLIGIDSNNLRYADKKEFGLELVKLFRKVLNDKMIMTNLLFIIYQLNGDTLNLTE